MPFGSIGIREALLYALIAGVVSGGLRTRWDRDRFATLVRGSYERIFGAPSPVSALPPMQLTAPGARRRRTRR
jgi:hypothetical protein